MRGLGLAVILLASPGFVLPAAAEPLGEKECARLLAEQHALIRIGVKKHMARGPEWAKANLTESDLNLIKRFISVDEMLKFRCPPPNKVADAAKLRKRRALAAIPPLPARRGIPEKGAKARKPGAQARPEKAPPLPVAKAGKG